MQVAELKKELALHGLDIKGNKSDLQARLKEFLQQQGLYVTKTHTFDCFNFSFTKNFQLVSRNCRFSQLISLICDRQMFSLLFCVYYLDQIASLKQTLIQSIVYTQRHP